MFTLSGGYRSSKQKLNHESLDLKTNLKHGKKQKFHNSGGTINFYKPRGPKYKEIMIRKHMVKEHKLTALQLCLIF